MKTLLGTYKFNVLLASVLALVACAPSNHKVEGQTSFTLTGSNTADPGAPKSSGNTNIPNTVASSAAQGTEHGGGGGDEIGVEFKIDALRAVEIMVEKKLLPEKVEKQSIKTLVENIKVLVSDDVLPVLKEKTMQEGIAINYPKKNLIVVNRTRWKNIANPTVRQGIALHEVLSIVGLESTGTYTYSQKYMTLKGLTCNENLCEGRNLLVFGDAIFQKRVESIFDQIKMTGDIAGGIKLIDFEKYKSATKSIPVCSTGEETGDEAGASLSINQGTIAPPSGDGSAGEYISLRIVSCGEPNHWTPNILLVRPPGSALWYGVINTMEEVALARSFATQSGFEIVINGSLNGAGGIKTMVTETFSVVGDSEKEVKIIKREQTTLAGAND